MRTGHVKFYDPGKNFGFIVPDGAEGGTDLYFNFWSLSDTMTVGELRAFRDPDTPEASRRVAFEVEEDSRTNRPRAVNVSVVVV